MFQTLKNLSKEELRAQARKWVMYGLIVLVIVLAAFSIANFVRNWYLTNKVSSLQAKVENVEAANITLQESVESIRNLRQIDGEVLGTLKDKLSSQIRRDSELKAHIELLEATNETARAYLDAPVHPDVARLLTNDPHRANRADATRADAGEMRGSGVPEDRDQP